MQLPIFLVAVVTLSLSGVTEAICTGQTFGIGTGVALSSGNTQWNVYDTSCNVKDTYAQSTLISVCDSSRFYCNFGTTNIGQYDDPVTGWAYNCTTDTASENCGGDAIIDCCFPFWGGGGDGNPLES